MNKPRNELATTDPHADLAVRTPSRPLDQNPAAIYLSSLGSSGSRRTMKDALRISVEVLSSRTLDAADRDRAVLAFPWHQLRYQHVEALRASFQQRYAPASANKMLCAVKGVLRHCRKLGLTSADDVAAARDVARVRGSRAPKGRALEPSQVAALREACGRDTIGARDVFILELLLNAGLRRDEAAALELSHISGRDLRVLGKGNKERIVPINDALHAAIAAWLLARNTRPGPLLYRANRSGCLMSGRGVTGDTIFSVVRRLGKRVDIRDLGPHDFRRTFASTLLDRGVDIHTVSRLLGHESIATTQKYDRRPERARRAAVEQLRL